MLRLRPIVYLLAGCDDPIALQNLVMQGQNLGVSLVNHINLSSLRLVLNPNPLNFVYIEFPISMIVLGIGFANLRVLFPRILLRDWKVV